MSKPTLLILYNASGTLLGHASYAYHHLRATPGKECSACALTHGPRLSLGETAGWTALKARLEHGEVAGLDGRGVGVRQLHTEDLTDQMKSHMKEEGLGLPCVILEKAGGGLATVMNQSELGTLRGDQGRFEEALGKALGGKL